MGRRLLRQTGLFWVRLLWAGYSGLGYSRGGLGISIGGYPGFYGGYGYGGYGSLYPRYPYYGNSGSIYSTQPYYQYGYNQVPATTYVQPGSSQLYSPIAPSDQRYSAAKPVSPTSDLRPGMVLPDGSTVISVGPLDSSAVRDEATDPIMDQPVEAKQPADSSQRDEPTEPEKIEAPVAKRRNRRRNAVVTTAESDVILIGINRFRIRYR